MAVLLVLFLALVAFLVIRALSKTGGKAPPDQRRGSEHSELRPGVRGPSITIRIGSSTEAPRQRRTPVDPDRIWVPANRSVDVAGYALEKGMLYVGEYLQSAGGYVDPEPALINPRLPVDRLRPNAAGSGMGYWPSYSTIDPASRAAYLEWLAGGASDPGAYIGYVFLYFYGLERRALADAGVSTAAEGEIDGIRREVERLLSIYRTNNSFRGYAGSFLEALRLRRLSSALYNEEPPLERNGYELPVSLRVALGQLVVEGKAVPPRWAAAWLMLHPEAHLRTPAKRCPEQFRRLFEIRYAERYGEGLRISPNKTRLTWHYQAASASLPRPMNVPLGDLPDVAALTAPLNKLIEIGDQCADELQPYSRFLASPDADRGDLVAAALLPAPLAGDVASPSVQKLQRWVQVQMEGADTVDVAAADLICLWSGTSEDKLAAKEAGLLSQLLEKLGYGLEPDLRFGAPSLREGERAVLFRLGSDVPKTASPQYGAATALAYVGVAVARADGTVAESEREYLLAHVESALHLSDGERRRLHAHLAWLTGSAAGLSGLRKRFEGLSDQQKHALAAFGIGVAGADGRVEPGEIRTLTKLYPMLGLSAEDVYAHLHALMSSDSTAPSDGPVTVQAGQAATGFSVPLSPDVKRKMENGVSLDMRAVHAKLKESAEVSALLSTIFVEESLPGAGSPAGPEAAGLVGPLDAAHSELLRILVKNQEMGRAEFEQAAAQLGLLPDGALELINDVAFELSDRALCEGDDPIRVDAEVAKEMVA